MNNKNTRLPAGRIAIIGATGFIGSHLANYYLSRNNFKTLTLISKKKKHHVNKKFVKEILCDHLDVDRLKVLLQPQDSIYHTAGLAWGISDSKNTTKIEFLIQHVLQNTISAFIVGSIIRKDQKLVWLSTNAVDLMMRSLSKQQRGILEKESQNFLECLQSRNMLGTPYEALNPLVWGLIVKHTIRSFPTAIEFSYAYSKYLGQKMLERLSQGNIQILKASDVYGPGQDLSQKALNPNFRARRIQRFVAAYRFISQSKTDWIPTNGKDLFGFSKNKNGAITHSVRNDFLYPTYIGDVIKQIIEIGKSKRRSKIIFESGGGPILNQNLAEAIRDFFHAKVEIHNGDEGSTKLVRKIFSENLLRFNENLKTWMSLRNLKIK